MFERRWQLLKELMVQEAQVKFGVVTDHRFFAIHNMFDYLAETQLIPPELFNFEFFFEFIHFGLRFGTFVLFYAGDFIIRNVSDQVFGFLIGLFRRVITESKHGLSDCCGCVLATQLSSRVHLLFEIENGAAPAGTVVTGLLATCGQVSTLQEVGLFELLRLLDHGLRSRPRELREDACAHVLLRHFPCNSLFQGVTLNLEGQLVLAVGLVYEFFYFFHLFL